MNKRIISNSKLMSLINNHMYYEKISILDYNDKYFLVKLFKEDKAPIEVYACKDKSTDSEILSNNPIFRKSCKDCARLVQLFFKSPRKFCIKKDNILYYIDDEYYNYNNCKEYCNSVTLKTKIK